MIGGIGDGTFAVCIAIAVGVLLCLVGYCVAPSALLGFVVVLIVLPFAVYGFILTAPKKGNSNDNINYAVVSTPHYRYRERQILPSDATAFDNFFPVRLVLLLVLGLASVGSVGIHIGLTLMEPPYKVPRIRCLREQLEEAHPTWYR